MPIAFKNFPGERALILTNDGITDGELFRIDKLNEKYPNLIQVPVSYIPDEVVVFSKRVDSPHLLAVSANRRN